jgi:pimeloyl-[acyl-carrier protein] synthase
MTSPRTSPTIEDEVSWFLTPGHPERSEINRDPHPFFDRLRTHDPVHKSAVGPWLVTRYDDVLALLQNPDLTRDVRARRLAALPPGAPTEARPGLRLIESGMLWRDPPDHTRLRRLVQRSFGAGAMVRWAPRIEAIARELLDELRQRETFDLLHDFSVKLPGIVIAEMIGMPADRVDDYEQWAAASITVQDPGSPEAARRHADELALACLAYFDELVEEKRRSPGDDILSSLLQADLDEDQRATHDEIVGMCTLLHVAGHETTSNVIANGMYHLIQQPDQYQLLRRRPELVDSAVEEILRYDVSARNTMPRWAITDTRVGDTVVPAGDEVLGVFGAAHRDPEHFTDPHRFDIARDESPHLAFGFGIHFCLGARLARAEATAAFRLLATEYPALRLAADDVVWRDVLILRALSGLPVAWT